MVEIFLKFHNFRSPFDSAAVQADAAARRGLAKRPSRAHGPPSARAPRGLAGRPPPRGAPGPALRSQPCPSTCHLQVQPLCVHRCPQFHRKTPVAGTRGDGRAAGVRRTRHVRPRGERVPSGRPRTR